VSGIVGLGELIMTAEIATAKIGGIAPFFIVSDVVRSVAFYCEKLGFAVEYQAPDVDPFFAIMQRDGAMIFMKSDRDVAPLPNHKRHHYMKWDAYVSVADPDALAAEFAARGVAFSDSLKDTEPGLRGFEISDPDEYILFFGRPR
jgi:catechol 2,3-dioxygenase-like lactoylglutathione lyase family enzyme